MKGVSITGAKGDQGPPGPPGKITNQSQPIRGSAVSRLSCSVLFFRIN